MRELSAERGSRAFDSEKEAACACSGILDKKQIPDLRVHLFDFQPSNDRGFLVVF
jgi:hypothetical protein